MGRLLKVYKPQSSCYSIGRSSTSSTTVQSSQPFKIEKIEVQQNEIKDLHKVIQNEMKDFHDVGTDDDGTFDCSDEEERNSDLELIVFIAIWFCFGISLMVVVYCCRM